MKLSDFRRVCVGNRENSSTDEVLRRRRRRDHRTTVTRHRLASIVLCPCSRPSHDDGLGGSLLVKQYQRLFEMESIACPSVSIVCNPPGHACAPLCLVSVRKHFESFESF